jgi:serine/threonine protein kinase
MLRIVDKATIKDKAGMVALEIGILKEVNHENIVSFLDTFESKHKYVQLLCVKRKTSEAD